VRKRRGFTLYYPFQASFTAGTINPVKKFIAFIFPDFTVSPEKWGITALGA
jgi:hypothetical protein